MRLSCDQYNATKPVLKRIQKRHVVREIEGLAVPVAWQQAQHTGDLKNPVLTMCRFLGKRNEATPQRLLY
jgi:hypothetical protein